MSSAATHRHFLIDIVNLITAIVGTYVEYVFQLFVRPPRKSLDGEIILITGSGNGIGREMCLYLGQSCPNVTLVCWDVNLEAVEATLKSLRSTGVKAIGYEVDISDRDQVAKCANKVREEVGFVTVIINNAGILHRTDYFLNLSPAEIEKTFNVNTLAQCWILREFLPKMVDRNSGHVVTMCSTGGHIANRKFSLYTASKFAVRGLVESIVSEMKGQNVNIKFTTVYPGFTNTQMIANLRICSRLPFPMQTLDPRDVAMEIVDSFRRNEEHVYLPRVASRLSVLLNNIMLPKAGEATKHIFSYESTGNCENNTQGTC